MSEDTVRPWTLEVRSWHILIMLALQLVGFGVGYGTVVERQSQQTEELRRIESERVITKDEFDEWKAELLSRMDRMENKLDEKIFNDKIGVK